MNMFVDHHNGELNAFKWTEPIFINKSLMTLTVIVISFVLLLDPTSITVNVFAQGNSVNQGMGQSLSSNQNALCVLGTGTLVSCNNLDAQSQTKAETTH